MQPLGAGSRRTLGLQEVVGAPVGAVVVGLPLLVHVQHGQVVRLRHEEPARQALWMPLFVLQAVSSNWAPHRSGAVARHASKEIRISATTYRGCLCDGGVAFRGRRGALLQCAALDPSVRSARQENAGGAAWHGISSRGGKEQEEEADAAHGSRAASDSSARWPGGRPRRALA